MHRSPSPAISTWTARDRVDIRWYRHSGLRPTMAPPCAHRIAATAEADPPPFRKHSPTCPLETHQFPLVRAADLSDPASPDEAVWRDPLAVRASIPLVPG